MKAADFSFFSLSFLMRNERARWACWAVLICGAPLLGLLAQGFLQLFCLWWSGMRGRRKASFYPVTQVWMRGRRRAAWFTGPWRCLRGSPQLQGGGGGGLGARGAHRRSSSTPHHQAVGPGDDVRKWKRKIWIMKSQLEYFLCLAARPFTFLLFPVAYY